MTTAGWKIVQLIDSYVEEMGDLPGNPGCGDGHWEVIAA